MTQYASLADVNTRLEQMGLAPITALTNPTDTEVEGLIDQIEAELDGVLTALSYPTVPCIAQSDINLLKRYAADKVSSMVFGIMVVTGDTLPKAVQIWVDDYRDFIGRLRREEQFLPSQRPEADVTTVIVGGFQDRDMIFRSLLPPPWIE